MNIGTWTVENYCSIGESVTVNFDEFTGITGRNDSGKSNLLYSLIDYRDFFIGESAISKGTYEEWFARHHCTYRDGPIIFEVTIELESSQTEEDFSERKEVVQSIIDDFGGNESQAKYLCREGYLSRLQHRVELAADGVKTEVLRGSYPDQHEQEYFILSCRSPEDDIDRLQLRGNQIDIDKPVTIDDLPKDDSEEVLRLTREIGSSPELEDWYISYNRDGRGPSPTSASSRSGPEVPGMVLSDSLYNTFRDEAIAWDLITTFQPPESASDRSQTVVSIADFDTSDQSTQAENRIDETIKLIPEFQNAGESEIGSLDNLMSQAINSISGTSLDLSGDKNTIKFESHANDARENEFKLQELSDGTLHYALILAELWRLLGDDATLLLIEEPEVHLDTYTQRQLSNLLKDIASEIDVQIVYSTHSEVFIESAALSNLYITRRDDTTTLNQTQTLSQSVDFGQPGGSPISHLIQPTHLIVIEYDWLRYVLDELTDEYSRAVRQDQAHVVVMDQESREKSITEMQDNNIFDRLDLELTVIGERSDPEAETVIHEPDIAIPDTSIYSTLLDSADLIGDYLEVSDDEVEENIDQLKGYYPDDRQDHYPIILERLCHQCGSISGLTALRDLTGKLAEEGEFDTPEWNEVSRQLNEVLIER